MTRVLMVRHRHRPNAVTSAVSLAEALSARDIEVVEDASGGGIDMVLAVTEHFWWQRQARVPSTSPCWVSTLATWAS